MDLAFIARVLDLVERSDIAELELTLEGARLRVVKAPGGGTPVPAPAGAPAPAAAQALPPAPPPPAAAGLHVVRAGFPGTFYRAPAPGAAPFVSVGDAVEEGRQLAIVEAMKTMNPVEADVSGRVARIAAGDGQAVETGDLLFEIEPRG